ncbi:MAG: DUF2325 domain-containing protein [Proteobacteria bacterium]|nr:DUF2325 domain-containing protein [Pseudomonadota bacterium]
MPPLEARPIVPLLSTQPTPNPSLPGSRRRRLWELPGHAHCPVVGVCLPLPALRRLVAKAGGPAQRLDDYELHCTAVSECKRRGPLTEALQRELDRRGLLALRRAAQAKDEPALAAWWREASAGKDLGSALWALLTHPSCTPALEDRVLAEVHMLQHQVGMATRVELARFEALIDENAVLARELAGAQQRCLRQAADFGRRSQALEAQALRTRADLITRGTELAQARDELQALQQADPALADRLALAQENAALKQRLTEVQRAQQAAEQQAERQRRRADDAQALLALRQQAAAAEPPAAAATAAGPWLAERAVLCVGGRSASVPVYRRVVESTGGRFLHHDGGSEDSPHKLDATLAAADLVICQTGCVSHDAYWRVKDHCKRTGKRCVFVEAPSRAALERALAAAATEVDA